MKSIQKFEVIMGCVRFGAWIVVGIISFVIIGGLVIAWLTSAPIFKLGDRLAQVQKQKRCPKRLKSLLGKKKIGRRTSYAVLWVTIFVISRISQAQSDPTILYLQPSNTNIWQNTIGDGFRAGTQSVSWSTGAGYGLRILGSRQSHDLAITSIAYGDMLGLVAGEGHWYQGNWEFRGEFFSGAQFSPHDDWLVGLTPHLRYNFATGTRWVPYVDVGAGVSATSIGPPDLSHYFEFNLQASTGVRWFIRNNIALSIEARYLHMSCAGLSTPNLGLNNVNAMVGISWFF